MKSTHSAWKRVATLFSAELALWVVLCSATTFAQTGAPPSAIEPVAHPVDQVGSPLNTEENAVQSLEALQKALASKEQELAALQQQLQSATDDVTREELRKKFADLKKEIDEQRQQFERFAVDVDLRPFVEEKERPFDWQEELSKLLRPIMAEIESATADSRAIGQLREQLEVVREKRDLAKKAVEHLDQLLQQPASPELAARLQDRHRIWSRTLEEASNEYTALDIQLQSKLAGRKSVLKQTTMYVRQFVRTRGLNLVLGILSFSAVFFGLRYVSHLVIKARQKQGARDFGSRLTALIFHILSVVGGLLAMLFVFNMVGDWFLLGIVAIFLLGVGWASINTLPQQMETVKLILNIGAVREGERMLYEGIPYRVDSLGFSARLVNPLLDGGTQLIPVKYLVGRTSRPNGEREDWFPCRAGDWVEMSDGRFGQVASQSPSIVQLEEPGGARTGYQMPEFLALKPRNLSAGFRVESVFGVDYKHQAAAAAEVPAKMKAKLEAGLSKIVEKHEIANIEVRFRQAGASSLDYDIWIDVKGSAAGKYKILRNAVQQLLLEASNENHWEIPFTQITVHQAP